MKYETINVDYEVKDPNLIVNGDKPVMVAIYKTVEGRKKLVSFAPSQSLADEICKSLNEGYQQAIKEM